MLVGYEGLDYTIQWQQSTDNVNWTDIAGANEETMDVVADEETSSMFYRVVVIIRVPGTAQAVLPAPAVEE